MPRVKPLTYSLKFASAIDIKGRWDIADAVLDNRNPQRIRQAAFQVLKRIPDIGGIARVFRVKFRFLCPVTMEDDGWTDKRPPKYAEKTELADGIKVYEWTKWITSQFQTDAGDIGRSQALEIVVPGPDDAIANAIMDAVKKVVLQSLTFAIRAPTHHGYSPDVATVFVPTESDMAMSSVPKIDEDPTIDVWYNTTRKGWMISGSTRHGLQNAQRAASRIRSALDSYESGDSGGAGKPMAARSLHERHSRSLMRFKTSYHDAMATTLAATTRT